MDILFPWRKQLLSKQKQQPPPFQAQDSGNYGDISGDDSHHNHHSLPHPQEQKLFPLRYPFYGNGGESDTFSSYEEEFGGGGMSISRQYRQQMQQQYHNPGNHEGGTKTTRRRIRSSKLFPTDESDRSLGSDLTDTFTATAAATSASGVGAASAYGNNTSATNSHDTRRLSLQSKDTSLPSYYPPTTNRHESLLHVPVSDPTTTVLVAPPSSSPVRQLLDVINMSILPSSTRLSSLVQAMEFFDHRDKSMHDSELRDEGAAYVLYQKLALVLQLSRFSDGVLLFEQRTMKKRQGGGGGGDMYDRTESNGTRRRPSLLDGGSGMTVRSNTSSSALNHPKSTEITFALQRQLEFDKEIAIICSCLEMVHRANNDAIAQTWDECGSEILPLLLRVLERPFQRIEQAKWMSSREKTGLPSSIERAVATAVTRDQKLAVQKATKILATYSLVPEAKQPICECVGMLHCLTRIIDTHYYNRVKPGAPVIGGMASKLSSESEMETRASTAVGRDEEEKISMLSQMNKNGNKVERFQRAKLVTSGTGLYMTEAARFNTIATLTNLAAHEANRMRMLHEPGLLDNICRVIYNERSDLPKECAALAIMNLSNGDSDHVPEMAKNDLVLETLLLLMSDDNPTTKRNAVVTIFNAACSDANTVRLARYRDGIILEALITLVGAADNNSAHRMNDEARANAAETLFNMSCSSLHETAELMANHTGLLECLAVTLHCEHIALETKMYCSATLRRMAEIIHYPMIAHGALLSALVKASVWTETDCIAEAYHSQAMTWQNRTVMAQHHGLLNALSRLASSFGDGEEIRKIRKASCLAIALMSQDADARVTLAHNEAIVMAMTQESYRSSNIGDEDDVETAASDEEVRNDATLSSHPRLIKLSLKNLLSAL